MEPSASPHRHPLPPSTFGFARLKPAGRRALPWLSLAVGVASAVFMDRSPARAGLIAAITVLGWALLIGLAQVHRLDAARLSSRRAWALRAARFGSIAASGWQIQLSLFFAAPFYWMATPGDLEHLAFLAVLAAAGLATLWDPWFRTILLRPIPALLLQALASFAALNVVLPILGASNRLGLWGAAFGTAVILPLAAVAMAREQRRRVAALAAATGLFIPGLLAVGGTRLIPPAPLRLVQARMGTALAGKEVVDAAEEVCAPAQLVCTTAIGAPRGLHDALFHVWRRDGWVTDRIALVVHGGRAEGFHTWSIKRHLGLAPALWSCSVETASGQLLGERTIRVTSSRSPEPRPEGPRAPASAPPASQGAASASGPDAGRGPAESVGVPSGRGDGT
ncbi:MAG: DUF2914 domain-containing protein [Deltaproteobacteria bacterium]|nr:DUF2914 domain-containing protein [Deltaproteobacteria bacterium]